MAEHLTSQLSGQDFNQPTSASCATSDALLLPQITIGNSDFPDVRSDGTLLVDKTAKIAALVKLKKVFFARPRRFGKSMLISMLKELFSHGTEKFEGLSIHDTWPVDRCYPVIALSLNVSPEPQFFEQQLCEHLINALGKAGFTELKKSTIGITTLSTLLWTIEDSISANPTVWLIDEWDFALSYNLDNKQAYTSNLHIMNIFFSWLRGLSNIRYLLVTGIGRYRNTTLFTGQDIINISMNPNFADLLGYTQAEVETNFAPYIVRATEMMGLSRDELLAQLKHYYDGFCFDENAEISLYCPWSINNFFQQFIDPNTKAQPAFRTFWMDSSNASAALRSFLNSRPIDISFVDDVISNEIKIKQAQFNDPTTFEQVDLKSLMVQAGLLSLKRVAYPNNFSPNTRSYLCGFPNLEVGCECAQTFMNFITAPSGDHEQEFRHTAEQLNLALKALDIASAVKALNTFLSTLPYDVWVKNIEATYRTFIHLFLIFSELSPVRAETYNGQGRSDLEVEFDRKLLVIELKRLEPGAKHKACLNLVQQAQDQIVKRGYGHNLDTWQKPPLKERKGLVLVLSDDTHQIVYWRLLSLEQAPQKVQVLGEDWGAPIVDPKVQSQKAQSHKAPAPQAQSAATAATSSADTSADATSTQVTSSRSAATNAAAAAAAAAATHQDSQKVEVITPSTLSIILSMSKPQAQTTDQVELNGEAFINGVMDFVAQLQAPNANFSADQITATVQMIIDLAHNKTSPHPVLVDRTDLVRTLVARLSQLK